MRYPKEKPFICTTVQYEDGRKYCRNTQQNIVFGVTCENCEKHYLAVGNEEGGKNSRARAETIGEMC